MSVAEVGPPDMASVEPPPALRDLVVCSLEPWDTVWRRNQWFTEALLRRHPALRVLYVEPPTDPAHDLLHGRPPKIPIIRSLRADKRLHALRPLKLAPRMFGPLADLGLHRQVAWTARWLRLSGPTLWLNDVTYAPMARQTDWAMVYDVTDDWLLSPLSRRELARQRALDQIALLESDEVVVCSHALAVSRGADRTVTLIPNGVDSDHLRRPRARPPDLPPTPTAVYVGTLHDARLDVDLIVELARSLPTLSVVLVGPDALSAESRRILGAVGNISRLGARPYSSVPAYLQHAQVLIVPHHVTPFTQSLDPIKAYEYAAVARPTVATPVAGFPFGPACVVAARPTFVDAVRRALDAGVPALADIAIPSWNERTVAFESVLRKANSRHALGASM